LIIDGVRQRRRRNPRDELADLRRGRQIWPRLLIASIFGFAVLLLDSVVGLVMYRVARAAINLAQGGPSRTAYSSWFLRAYLPPSAAAGGSRRGFGAARRNRRGPARLRLVGD